MRSATAPLISAGVMIANIIWKSMKLWAGTVGAYAGLGAAATPRSIRCVRGSPQNALPGANAML